MSCEFDKELLRMYSLECLDASETELVEVHLEHCRECRTELAGFKTSMEMLSDAFDEEAPDWLLTRTMANVRARSERRPAWGIPMIAGSTVVLFVLVFTLKMHRTIGVSPPSPQQVEYKEEKVRHESLLNDLLAGGIEGDNENPVDDRFIYDALDVAPEVAELLL